jgi:hypothetical protein
MCLHFRDRGAERTRAIFFFKFPAGRAKVEASKRRAISLHSSLDSAREDVPTAILTQTERPRCGAPLPEKGEKEIRRCCRFSSYTPDG